MEASGRSSGISDSDEGVVVQRLDVLEGPSGRRRWLEALKGRIVAETRRWAQAAAGGQPRFTAKASPPDRGRRRFGDDGVRLRL